LVHILFTIEETQISHNIFYDVNIFDEVSKNIIFLQNIFIMYEFQINNEKFGHVIIFW